MRDRNRLDRLFGQSRHSRDHVPAIGNRAAAIDQYDAIALLDDDDIANHRRPQPVRLAHHPDVVSDALGRPQASVVIGALFGAGKRLAAPKEGPSRANQATNASKKKPFHPKPGLVRRRSPSFKSRIAKECLRVPVRDVRGSRGGEPGAMNPADEH